MKAFKRPYPAPFGHKITQLLARPARVRSPEEHRAATIAYAAALEVLG